MKAQNDSIINVNQSYDLTSKPKAVVKPRMNL